MATVYKAYDTRLERDVAVKIIRVDQFPPATLEMILKRFEREAKALAKLSHPNIVSVIDYGEYEGVPYLVMVYLPGGTLKEKLGGQIPWGEAAYLLLPVAHALAYAHREGVIHRDVKPNNILMARSGDPMLTDFGIAKILDIRDTQTLTGSGVGIGTPEYMAPEQALGNAIDARVDIYALGVVFYEMVTGKKPFTADTPMAVVFKHISDPLPRPSEYVPDLPEAVEHVLFKALAKKPEDRYADMDDLVAVLEDLSAGQGLIKSQTAKKAAREQAEREAAEKAAREQAEREAAEKAAREQAEREAAEKAAREQAGREVAEKAAREQAERDAAEKAAREQAGREAAEKDAREQAEHEAAEKAGREQAEREAAEKAALEQAKRESAEKAAREKADGEATISSQVIEKKPVWYRRIKPAPAIFLVISVLFIALIGILPWKNLLAPNPAPSETTVAALPATTAPALTLTPFVTDEPTLSPTADFTPTRRVEPVETITPWPSEITEKGAQMALIPAGTFSMGSAKGEDNERPVHSVTLNAFYMDVYEVTNALYKVCVEAGACKRPKNINHYHNYVYVDHPVVYVDWNMAKTYCEWRNARLPTEAEWEYAARGTDGRTYPWGEGIDKTFANYNNAVGDTTIVGSYEKGKSFFGIYDMAGNVKEMVSSRYMRYPYNADNGRENLSDFSGNRVLRGGSWVNFAADVRSASRLSYTTTDTLKIYGFRCARSSPPSSTPAATATPTLNIVLTQTSEKDGMVMVYVSEGAFTMGSDSGESDEKPVHTVFLDAFWIDQTEVTNGMYALCVKTGICQHTGSASLNDSASARYPVSSVSWNNSKAYCEWAGRRLPTEAEWEKAARGTDGRTYPWGNDTPSCDLVNYYNCSGKNDPVGSYPNGASPYGALDMAGNVWEWVADWYDAAYYQNSPSSNPLGPASGTYRVSRGSSWGTMGTGVGHLILRISSRATDYPDIRDKVGGFRCARSSP